jgi:CMP-N,N'-diacetyllegionaminic acid synthase
MQGTLAVIPARGGSRGVPRKNLALVAGRPLIAYTIDAALRCQDLTRTMLSTDDPAIADAARTMGCDVPYLRPAELATDATPTVDVVLHALGWFEEKEGFQPRFLVVLQPTSPLRTADDIACALAMLDEDAVDAVVGVAVPSTHPQWAMTVTQDGYLSRYLPQDSTPTRRQDLAPAYAPNGAVFAIRREALLTERTLYPRRTVAYVMPPERSLDIDNPWDLHVADLLIREGH